jgi:adenylate kinase family enzyme
MGSRMTRIAIVGVAGSGKTTLAQRLSHRLGLHHIELDALFWGPGWSITPAEELRPRVEAALAGDDWVVDGNYNSLCDLIWTSADVLVWLDFPLWLVMLRLLRRTIRRIVTRENLWNTGCHETWRGQFWSRDSLFLYALTSQRKHRKRYPTLLRLPEYTHLKAFRLRSQRAVDDWLDNITQGEMDV